MRKLLFGAHILALCGPANHIFKLTFDIARRVFPPNRTAGCIFWQSLIVLFGYTKRILTVSRRLLARRFLLNAVIGSWQVLHVVVLLAFRDPLNCSTQKPQKLCPQGIAT